MNIYRIVAMASKEWREIVRDRLFLVLAFMVTPLLMVVFGYGFSFDVKNIPFVVLDYDRSELSRDYVGRFVHSQYFLFQGNVERESEIDDLINRDKIKLAIVIPKNFSSNLLAGRPAQIQTIIDGISPFRAQTTKGYIAAINGHFSNERLVEFLTKKRGIAVEDARKMFNSIKLEIRYLYNEAVSSTWSMVPSLIMLLLMITPPFLTAVSVVREKETGSIYNVYASTLSSMEFIVGKLLPYVSISLINCVVIFAMALYWFQVPFKGSLLIYLSASLAYVVCTTGIGLLVSFVVSSQLAAVVITGIVSLLPVMLFSGLIVPVQSLSYAGQIFAHIIPAMYYNEILQGLFLKGLGLKNLLWQIIALYGYSFLIVLIARGLFTKRPNY